ncbi:MAG: hypothetical protein AABZ32_12015 [Bacteroidota bacterium]
MRKDYATIRKIAIKEMANYPKGIRQKDLYELIAKNSEYSHGEISNATYDIYRTRDKDVVRISRGIYCLKKFTENITTEPSHSQTETTIESFSKNNESHFYQAFADWLVKGDLQECVFAFSAGNERSYLGKWGNPDVIGLWEKSQDDAIGETEIITAEIKISKDKMSLIEAFGQACSYRLFSHKTYIVIPKQCSANEIDRVDSLCMLFGIGLITYDETNVDESDFKVVVRAMKNQPDVYYANEFYNEKRNLIKANRSQKK